ncbi:hypothetical protein ACFQV4_09520 [Streptomyces thermocarboxydus]
MQVHDDHKVTWCEFAVAASAAPEGEPSVERADALLDVYVTLKPPACSYDRESGRVRRRVEEESVIDMVTDLLFGSAPTVVTWTGCWTVRRAASKWGGGKRRNTLR